MATMFLVRATRTWISIKELAHIHAISSGPLPPSLAAAVQAAVYMHHTGTLAAGRLSSTHHSLACMVSLQHWLPPSSPRHRRCRSHTDILGSHFSKAAQGQATLTGALCSPALTCHTRHALPIGKFPTSALPDASLQRAGDIIRTISPARQAPVHVEGRSQSGHKARKAHMPETAAQAAQRHCWASAQMGDFTGEAARRQHRTLQKNSQPAPEPTEAGGLREPLPACPARGLSARSPRDPGRCTGALAAASRRRRCRLGAAAAVRQAAPLQPWPRP